MNFADLFKKNIIFIPVVASIVVGSFTGIKYVLNLTTTINQSEQQIVNLEKDLSIAQDKITEIKVVYWGTSIQCVSPLKGNKIFWSKK